MSTRVFVGQPVYLGAQPLAVLSATAFASDPNVHPGRTAYKHMESPFHCGNFNSLWAYALNTRKKMGWTHFAMLHQDIRPALWWVDRGVEMMAETGVDLLSVVMPLKDDHGVTSCAALNMDTLATRRLTMKEIVNYLPPTFTSDDLPKLGYKNHKLLHSSGCFLCDFTKPWVERTWFECASRILRNAAGEFYSAVWDEGWNFTVQLYQMNCKVACTREISANHLGGGVWGNDTAWGEWETDLCDTDQEWILGRAPVKEKQTGGCVIHGH